MTMRWFYEQIVNKRSVIVLLAGAFFYIAAIHGLPFLYLAFAYLVAILVSSFLYARLALWGLSIDIDGPGRILEGQLADFTLKLANRNILGYYALEVRTILVDPYGQPRENSFFVPRLRGRGRLSIPYRLPMTLRGEYRERKVIVRTSFPLGLFTSQTIFGEVCDLLVLPNPLPLADFPIPGGRRQQTLGLASYSLGSESETIGIRAYQSFDSFKHIHWPATARMSSLMVREFNFETSSDVSILLDLQKSAQWGQGESGSLEYAVKIAAAIGQFTIQNGNKLALFGLAQREVTLPLGANQGHYQRLLETLARVRADGRVRFAMFLEKIARESLPHSTLVLIYPQAGRLEAEFLQTLLSLRARHVNVLAIALDKHSRRANIEHVAQWAESASTSGENCRPKIGPGLDVSPYTTAYQVFHPGENIAQFLAMMAA
jgi:uncharacterized protein (DUF58 family)